jgi:hemoglobin
MFTTPALDLITCIHYESFAAETPRVDFRTQREGKVDATHPRPDREQIVAGIMAETGIDEPMIERLVRSFYDRARRDPLIGPVFEYKVKDWEAHIQRMCAFWSSVALMSGRYHGQPMVAHTPLPVGTPHFDRWLTLFAETAREVCPPPAARHFVERAHRIADSLELGIAASRGRIQRRRPRPASTFLTEEDAAAAAAAHAG